MLDEGTSPIVPSIPIIHLESTCQRFSNIDFILYRYFSVKKISVVSIQQVEPLND